MRELKTLKDIEEETPLQSEISMDRIRAEAVKWVKAKQFNQREPLDADDWKKFFNLTEEDLK